MATEEKSSKLKITGKYSRGSDKYNSINLCQNAKQTSHLIVQSKDSASNSNKNIGTNNSQRNENFNGHQSNIFTETTDRLNFLHIRGERKLRRSRSEDSLYESEFSRKKQQSSATAKTSAVNNFAEIDNRFRFLAQEYLESRERQTTNIDAADNTSPVGNTSFTNQRMAEGEKSDKSFYERDLRVSSDDNSGSDDFDIDKVPFDGDSESSGGFDLDKIPEENPTEKDVEPELELDLSKYNDLNVFLRRATPAEINNMHKNFLQHLPNNLHPVPLDELLTIPCCEDYCCSSFSADRVMRERMRLPTTCASKETLYYAVMQCQFYLLKNCFLDDAFYFEIFRFPVCPEFFRRVYVFSNNRFDKLCQQIMLGFKQAIPHGNADRRYERCSTLRRFAKLVALVDDSAEPHPSGIGFLMPPGTTKVGLLRDAGIYKAGGINPSRELKRFVPTILCRKSNSHTKCERCLKLRNLIQSDRLNPAQRQQAEKHRFNHRRNYNNDRRDYFVREERSQNSNQLVSIAHDAMSNQLNKCPHLLQNRGKKLGDASKMICGLSIALVHKKYEDKDTQVFCYWSPDHCNAPNANQTVSQLMHALSQLDEIPNHISFQLDNCAVNKNYTLFGAFGLLLKWVPQIIKIYICTAEVGHTHNDVDQRFGILANKMKTEEIYSPQGYMKFAEDNLKNVVSNNLIPVIYDFNSIIHSIKNAHGEVNANHYFEISRNSEGEAIIKIARYVRSNKYVINGDSENPADPAAFKMFKEEPDLEIFPSIIPPKPFDKNKHAVLCNAVRGGVIPEKGYEELLALPEIIDNYPEPEIFKDLLQRIRNKVITTTSQILLPEEDDEDVENVQMDAFLNSPEIDKIWKTLEDSIFPSMNEEISLKGRRKRKIPPTAEDAPSTSTAPSSSNIGRPKKTVKQSALIDPKPGRQRRSKTNKP